MKLRIAPEPELITSAAALSQFFSPEQPPTTNDSSDGERQTEGYAHMKPNGFTNRTTMTKAKTLATKM